MRLIKTFVLLAFLSIFTSLPAYANENADFSFDMGSSLTLDESDSYGYIPDITIQALREVTPRTLSIHIPNAIRGIVSGDLTYVVQNGTASSKVDPITLDSISLDHRTIALVLNETLLPNETLTIGGLILKAYQSDNSPQAIGLQYPDDGGAVVTLLSSTTIRLNIGSGTRRRYGAPEPIRNLMRVQPDDSTAVFTWTKGPDLDLNGYQFTLKKHLSDTIVNEFFGQDSLSYTIEDLVPGSKYELTFQVLNNGGFLSEVTLDFNSQATPAESVEEPPTELPEEPASELPVISSTNFTQMRRSTSQEFISIYQAVVPPDSYELPLEGDSKPTLLELLDLMKTSTLFPDFGVVTLARLDRYEGRSGSQLDVKVSHSALISLIIHLARGERIPTTLVLPRPRRDALETESEWDHRLLVYFLQRKGVVDDAGVYSDPLEELRLEDLIIMLDHFRQPLQ
ncbi:MAG: fibronectin type III domain-containing protein [bacterium]|nr:fibronectin type III domain-containing protein [bacterium]